MEARNGELPILETKRGRVRLTFVVLQIALSTYASFVVTLGTPDVERIGIEY